ncbi:hypothetical protein VE04_09434, partial [Pseudogymnoascus sp. 24MN13]
MVVLGLAIATPTTMMPTMEINMPAVFTMAINTPTPITKPKTTTFSSAVEKTTTTMMTTPIFSHIHHITATATAPETRNLFRVSLKRNTLPQNWWMNIQGLLVGFMNV